MCCVKWLILNIDEIVTKIFVQYYGSGFYVYVLFEYFDGVVLLMMINTMQAEHEVFPPIYGSTL